MLKKNPFDECPVYETDRFRFTLVCEADAEDLFVCYTDEVTLSHMNNDNCGGEWRPLSSEELKFAWQKDYERRTFLRWSVKIKKTNVAVGTIEIAPLPWGKWFFGEDAPIGILRLDILSKYENESVFAEITAMMGGQLARDFEVYQVIMKAPPNEPERVAALVKNRFEPYESADFPFEHYYGRYISYE